MNRRENIRRSLARIRVAKKLVAQQVEFIYRAKAIGYEPFHGADILQRFCNQLSDHRTALVSLTRNSQKDFAKPARTPPPVRQMAA